VRATLVLLVSCCANEPAHVAIVPHRMDLPLTQTTPAKRRVMPNGVVHVLLVGFDAAPAVDLDADAALAKQGAVDAKYEPTYRDAGHEQWFFHAFDERTLFFVMARWEPDGRRGGSG
jgi:hypothetical protein